jgi:fermentation-respiration switch protein FrsA (DUF1100 family)
MAILKWLVLLVLVGYVGVAAVLYFAQRAMMYLPDTARTSPTAVGLPAAEEVILDTADGERLIAWHVPPRGDKPVVVYFHGNGASLAVRGARFNTLTRDGTGLLALSYRGFGGSTGHPSEAGLLRDAAAAYRFAAARYKPDRIVLWGESLGTAVAVAVAAEQPVGRVILESPFTSTADVAASTYFFVPVRLLMKDQFHSDERIGRVTAPVLVIHGDRDNVVPIRFGERLYTLIRSPKRFVRLSGANHNDHDQFGTMEVVRTFLAERFD